ncbi:MAG: 4Fe-4S binding protein, partial [Pseudomonadota bacterium]
MKQLRKIIRIDEDKCNGCGLCVPSCAEGALQSIDGKAKLVSEIFCDGLGACLGECPEDALTIEECEVEAFDQAEVDKHFRPTPAPKPIHSHTGSCPGSALRTLQPDFQTDSHSAEKPCLAHWPVQLMLVPPQAPFLKGADLLICADCVPFAFPNFHSTYLKGRAVLVGCPKLDNLDYYRTKLKDIVEQAKPKSITVLLMEVPCCMGIAQATVEACKEVAPHMPVEIHT